MEYFVGDSADHFSWLDNSNVNNNNGVHFTVDDLLDFSKEDETMTDAFFDTLPVNSTDSSTLTAVDSCNSSISGGGDGQFNGNVSCRSFNDTQFSGNELCVPYDDIAELEWLSNFVEQSFSTDEINFIPIKNDAVAADSSSSTVTAPNFPADVSVPGKARSKRSRAAPCDWSSRLLLVTPSSSKTTSYKKKEPATETLGRKCLHCASEKTPQWRTGPLGPKTLCNACGVRYKSGRLVPEYRPASSPTFVSAKHSNSHRKVMELRRQKEVQPMMGHHHQPSVFNGGDEFLINAAHYRHMM